MKLNKNQEKLERMVNRLISSVATAVRLFLPNFCRTFLARVRESVATAFPGMEGIALGC